MSEHKAYSILETAQILGIGRSTLYALIKEGQLPVRKLGKRTLVLREDLEHFMASLPSSTISR